MSDAGNPTTPTPGTAPASATPAQAAPAPASTDAGPSAAEVLSWDPFEIPSSPDGGAPAPKPGESAPTTPPAEVSKPADGTVKPGDPPAAPTTPPATPATPASPPAAPANFEQLLREQTAAIREMAAPKAPQGSTEPTPPKFNLGLPPQIISGLRSEDEKEFATSMHAVVNGIANHVWDTVTKHLEGEYLQRVQQTTDQRLQSTATTQAVAQDFYGKYTTLSDPVLRPMVQQAGLEVAQARIAAGKPVAWGPELRDEIAERVFQALPALRPAPAAGGNPPPPAPPAPNGRFVSGGGGPRGVAPTAGEAEQFGADLLN